MRRIRTIVQAVLGATAVTGGLLALSPAAHLAGGCTYGMTTAHGGASNALPVITTPIEVVGPATVTNASPLGLFRIAEVGPTGRLTLTTGVAFTCGNVLGHGGGILNRGAVTLTGSTLTGNSTLLGDGGAIYNGLRGTLTVTDVSGSPLFITGNSAGRGGGISAVDSTATTLTRTAVTDTRAPPALGNSGGACRQGGTMTTDNTPITANSANNCVGSVPAVPDEPSSPAV